MVSRIEWRMRPLRGAVSRLTARLHQQNLESRHTWQRVIMRCVSLAIAISLSLSSVQGATERADYVDNQVVRAYGGSHIRRFVSGHHAVHELAGRPFVVRAGGEKSMLLRRVGHKEHASTRRSSRRADTLDFQQYLVRIAHPVPHRLTDYLHELAGGGFIQYLPHDMFVVLMDQAALENARKASGVVDIYVFPPAMKIDTGMLEYAEIASREEGNTSLPSHNDPLIQNSDFDGSPKYLHVLLVLLAFRSGQEWKLHAAGMATEWREAFSTMDIQSRVEIVSKYMAVVKVIGASALKKVVAWLAQQPLVYFLQEQKKIRLLDKLASFVIQSPEATTNSIWARGITGTGQIIGFADTGIDFDHCLFRDDSMPIPPRCSGSGHVKTAGCINKVHRKIVTYRKFTNTDYSDYFDGHGTHVTGCAAGSIAADNAAYTAEVSGV